MGAFSYSIEEILGLTVYKRSSWLALFKISFSSSDKV